LPPLVALPPFNLPASLTSAGLWRGGHDLHRLGGLEGNGWDGNTDKHSFRHVAEVPQEVPAVGLLHGVRSSQGGSVCIHAGAIPSDDFNAGISG